GWEPKEAGAGSAKQRSAQRVEPDRPEVERPTVEFLEIESRALSGAGFVADVLPQTLTDLVARGLSGPAEIAVELEREERPVHGDVLREELPCFRTVPGSPAELGWSVDPEVEADVDDHP